jgi:hypothetical protein
VSEEGECYYCGGQVDSKPLARKKLFQLSSFDFFTPMETTKSVKINLRFDCHECRRQYNVLNINLDWISEFAGLKLNAAVAFDHIFTGVNNINLGSLFEPGIITVITEPIPNNIHYFDKETYHVIFRLAGITGYLDCRWINTGKIIRHKNFERHKNFTIVDVVRLI